jgi:hypothetical protein
MGKSTFVKFFKKEVDKTGHKLIVISSDEVRKMCMDEMGRNDKRKSREILFEKTAKRAREIFFKDLENAIRKVYIYIYN